MQNKAPLYPNVHAELARLGVTLWSLAEYMGTSPQNLHNKLRGITNLSVKDMKAIQEFLKVNGGESFTLDYLFYDEK